MANNDGLIIAGLAHYVNTHRMNWMKVLGHGGSPAKSGRSLLVLAWGFAVAVDEARVVAGRDIRPYIFHNDFKEMIVTIVVMVEEVMIFNEAKLPDLYFIGPGRAVFFIGAAVAVLVVVFTAVHVKAKQVVIVPIKGVLDEALQIFECLLGADGDGTQAARMGKQGHF